ncbi:MAG: glycerophosphodiester phosphodiesterase family protein [Pseudomonadota bacterium]
MLALRSPVRSFRLASPSKLTASLRLAERFNISDYVYAHRGLWSDTEATENSHDAFMAATKNDLGIEFDVRPSADGIPIVFHDPVLDRMTHETGFVADRPADKLNGLPLKGGGAIPSLENLLQTWPPKTPLLCELKIDGATDPVAFAATVSAALSFFPGPAAAMSFSAEAVAALPKSLMRGQLLPPLKAISANEFETLLASDVDYFACHYKDARAPQLQAARAERPLIVWTVRSEQDCADLAPITDAQIFEGFDPALAKRHILNR